MRNGSGEVSIRADDTAGLPFADKDYPVQSSDGIVEGRYPLAWVAGAQTENRFIGAQAFVVDSSDRVRQFDKTQAVNFSR